MCCFKSQEGLVKHFTALWSSLHRRSSASHVSLLPPPPLYWFNLVRWQDGQRLCYHVWPEEEEQFDSDLRPRDGGVQTRGCQTEDQRLCFYCGLPSLAQRWDTQRLEFICVCLFCFVCCELSASKCYLDCKTPKFCVCVDKPTCGKNPAPNPIGALNWASHQGYTCRLNAGGLFSLVLFFC